MDRPTAGTIVSQDPAVAGPLHYAIIDEVDNILIDEARTPLIISGPAFEDVHKYAEADRIARQLKQDAHFEVNEKDHTTISRTKACGRRAAGRRRELLHRRQHGMAALDRQLARRPTTSTSAT